MFLITQLESVGSSIPVGDWQPQYGYTYLGVNIILLVSLVLFPAPLLLPSDSGYFARLVTVPMANLPARTSLRRLNSFQQFFQGDYTMGLELPAKYYFFKELALGVWAKYCKPATQMGVCSVSEWQKRDQPGKFQTTPGYSLTLLMLPTSNSHFYPKIR